MKGPEIGMLVLFKGVKPDRDSTNSSNIREISVGMRSHSSLGILITMLASVGKGGKGCGSVSLMEQCAVTLEKSESCNNVRSNTGAHSD